MAHISIHELQNRLESASKQVEVGAFYTHYKHPEKRYKVLAVGLQEATEEPCVIYQSDLGITWVRNLTDWLAEVPDSAGKSVPRFQKLVIKI